MRIIMEKNKDANAIPTGTAAIRLLGSQAGTAFPVPADWKIKNIRLDRTPEGHVVVTLCDK